MSEAPSLTKIMVSSLPTSLLAVFRSRCPFKPGRQAQISFIEVDENGASVSLSQSSRQGIQKQRNIDFCW